jgi:hypothetical protein
MRSVFAFLACTGFIVWAHSCDTRIVGLKAYAAKPHNAPVYNSDLTGPDVASLKPTLLAHYMHAVYHDTINVSARRIYPD